METRQARPELSTTTRYRFSLQNRRIVRISLGALAIIAIMGILHLLSQFNALPPGGDVLLGIFYILAVIAFIVLLPMLVLLYGYARAGIWLEPERIRALFPGEDEQQLTWAEARFAVDEGEIYLAATRGKEGFGHIFGDQNYLRLHLEGVDSEVRTRIWRQIEPLMPIRHPERFTLMTLMNSEGELVARGRLYLFEQRLLCVENRGQRRVVFVGPRNARRHIQREPEFHLGRFSCDAFSVQYEGRKYTIMLGYELTASTSVGRATNWSTTGDAESWIAALREDR